MTLKGDFHMHTSHSGDCDASPRDMVRGCRDVGLTCIAVTDHNTIRGALEVRELADFTVIIGEEVKSSQGDIIGLFLEEEIPRGLSPAETVSRIKGQGGLVVVPHPVDAVRRGPLAPAALRQVLPQVDFMEVLNARTIFKGDLSRCRSLAREAAVTPLAVSDAHTPGELGSAYMELDGFNGSPQSFKDAIERASLCGRRSNPMVHAVTAYVKLKKRLGMGERPAGH